MLEGYLMEQCISTNGNECVGKRWKGAKEIDEREI